jgi:type II secretory pathway pseudopilin PulG
MADGIENMTKGIKRAVSEIRRAGSSSGITLVELLVALGVSSILMLGVIAAFQTAQRTAAVGEAREHIYQNGRVALDLMAREIRNAQIDDRNRDLVFVSADGLAAIGRSILEYTPNAPAVGPYTVTYRGLGNAQVPHGIDPTGVMVHAFYSDSTLGFPLTRLTLKATEPLPGDVEAGRERSIDRFAIAPGPPDRLDFVSLTTNFADNVDNESRLAEVRYIITTETFVDDLDNDGDGSIDEADNLNGLPGGGDMIISQPIRTEELNPESGQINALSLFHLRRAIDVNVDKNPFSVYDYPSPGDPYGRYPDRRFGNASVNPHIGDFLEANGGESIGSYIYDLQFEFYGKIAIALDSDGAPEVWGLGWGHQDVRGEDMGLDLSPEAVGYADPHDAADEVTVTNNGTAVTGGASTSWTAALNGGLFIVWDDDALSDGFDTKERAEDVYVIDSVTPPNDLTLARPYTGQSDSGLEYRIIEPTQADGILQSDMGNDGLPDQFEPGYDPVTNADPNGDNYHPSTNPTGTEGNGAKDSQADAGEDLGADGIVDDELDSLSLENDGTTYGTPIGIPSNVSDNDGDTAEPSIGEGNERLDSRVMGIWDSRSPDPRNPRRAAELDGLDSDGDATTGATPLQTDGLDNDLDGFIDDAAGSEYATPEDDLTTEIDETVDLTDNDIAGTDGVIDDRFYEPAGRPEGVDEPDEADTSDDSLPRAVRITIAIRDPQQSLGPVVLSTTVWLSAAE